MKRPFLLLVCWLPVLAVQELRAGIYVCKLLADGQPIATQKLVVVE